MNEFQTIATVIMALIIGFVIGRGSKKTKEYNPHQLTPEEWASLQPEEEGRNPYADVHQDVLDAIQSDNKIEAIKRFRQHHASSLKEAKDAIEAIFRNFN